MAPSSSAACRVWVRAGVAVSCPTRCSFGTSVVDSLQQEEETSSNNTNQVAPPCGHYDRLMVSLQEKGSDLYLSLSPLSLSSSSMIPMGRARACPRLGSTACPTTDVSHKDKAPSLSTNKPFVGLAVVGLLLDPTRQRLLLTRRPAYMRSFPGAWVLPGGSVDVTDGSLAAAVAREVKEETGLIVPAQDWQVQSVWESVYPTTVQDVSTYVMKRHHIVVYLSAQLPAWKDFDLCTEEVDAAAWLSRDQVLEVLAHNASPSSTTAKTTTSHDKKTISMQKRTTATHETVEIALQDFFGIYPVQNSQGTLCGIAQGSLFAMEEFCKSQDGWARPLPKI